MTSKATYPSHPEPTRWSPVVDMFHGIGCSPAGCMCEAIQDRLEFANNPKEAGR